MHTSVYVLDRVFASTSFPKWVSGLGTRLNTECIASRCTMYVSSNKWMQMKLLHALTPSWNYVPLSPVHSSAIYGKLLWSDEVSLWQCRSFQHQRLFAAPPARSGWIAPSASAPSFHMLQPWYQYSGDKIHVHSTVAMDTILYTIELWNFEVHLRRPHVILE